MLTEVLRGERLVTADEVLGLIRVGFGGLALLKVVDLSSRLPMTDLAWPSVIIAAWVTAAVAVVRSHRGALFGAPAILLITIYLFAGSSELRNQHMYLLGWIAVVVFLSAARATHLVDVSGSALVLAARIQVTIVYAFSFAAKITEDFLAGSVVALHTQNRPVGRWLGLDSVDAAWPFIVISVLAMGIEGILAIGLWSRRWWRQFFALGLMFHITLLILMAEDWVSLARLAVFGGLVMQLYPAFLPTADRAALVESVQAPTDRRMPIT